MCGALFGDGGIELDSVVPIARLPADKLEAACRLVQQWRSRKWCNHGQLEFSIGHLQQAAKVVWHGRILLRRMTDFLCCFRKRDHPISLKKEFRLDLDGTSCLHGTELVFCFFLVCLLLLM